LEFRLSALMDSDLAWVNGKSGRQSWRFPALYNIGSHLPFYSRYAQAHNGLTHNMITVMAS